MKEYIIIHGKCPKECVNVSVKYVVHQNRTVKRESKWSPEVTFCSGMLDHAFCQQVYGIHFR